MRSGWLALLSGVLACSSTTTNENGGGAAGSNSGGASGGVGASGGTSASGGSGTGGGSGAGGGVGGMGGSGTGAGSGTGGAGPCKEAPLGCEGIAASACKHEWDVCAQAPACLCAFRCVGADQSGNQSAALVDCEIKYSVGTGPLDALVNCAKTVAPNCFAFK